MTSSTTITLNGVATFTVEARAFDSLDEAHESGLFYDSDTATWYEPTAEIVAYRRARHAEAGDHPFFAAMRRRYDAETDRMEARIASRA